MERSGSIVSSNHLPLETEQLHHMSSKLKFYPALNPLLTDKNSGMFDKTAAMEVSSNPRSGSSSRQPIRLAGNSSNGSMTNMSNRTSKHQHTSDSYVIPSTSMAQRHGRPRIRFVWFWNG